MPDISLPYNGWEPRGHQWGLWSYLQAGGKRAMVVWHRRAGKDEVCLHHAAVSMIKRPGNYWHCLPEFLQGRKAIWTAINAHTGKRRIDEAFPTALRDTVSENEMFIRLKNGSTWQIIGSDRYDATVGSGVAGITYSEWALANPSAWGYHRPMLEENNGWGIFITTPRGRNHAKALFDHAQSQPANWFSERLTAFDTGALTADQLDDALAEYQALYGYDVGTAQYRQEYMCDWNAAILGAFYAFEMAAVRNEQRIAPIDAIPDQPVHRAWDLGTRDDTSIWFFQPVGSQLFILDHYAASGVGLEHFRDVIEEKHETHGWKHGTDYVPHDAGHREWTSGRTRIETMMDLRPLRPERCPDVSKEDGINAVRRTLPLCVFHPRTEVGGIEALEQYRREWDDEKKTFRASAVHDWSSHPCLVGDTLIATTRGEIAISEVRVGDMVLTPCGPARVLAAGPTGRADELVEICMADGRRLCGTPQHVVFGENGLVYLDEFACSDRVLSEGSELWRKALSSSTAGNIGFRDAITGATTGARPDRRTYTGRFGKRLTEQFRRALTSITGMVMAPITSLPILRLSSGGSMRDSIRWSDGSAGSCSRQVNSRGSGLLNGMLHPKGSHGTPKTARPHGITVSGIFSNAKNAVANIGRRIRPDPNSVISTARWRTCDAGAGKPLVYDLTVEKHHCYLANGILVSNSDSFRYLALAWRKPQVKEIRTLRPAKPVNWAGSWIIPPPREPRRGEIVV